MKDTKEIKIDDDYDDYDGINVDTVTLTMMVQSIAIEETNKGVNTLYDIVCKGYDGAEPILVRISTLEKSNIDHLNRIVTLEKLQMQFKIEERKSQWKFLGVVFISTLGWLTALLTNEKAQNLDFMGWLFHIIHWG